MASVVNRLNGSRTLNPTALVNEAWIKMAAARELEFQDPLHFKRIAARAMRQIVIEYARRKVARKRGGEGAICFVTFDEQTASTLSLCPDLIALDDALQELARKDSRQAQVVESKFFGGMEVSEIAAMLAVSEATVHRDWEFARAWLSAQVRKSHAPTSEKRKKHGN